MFPKIFLNLPVADLARSQAYFSALGWSFDPAFTDENAACLVISDQIRAMLVVEPYFLSFATDKAIADTATTAEVILAVGLETRDEVDVVGDRALAAGGTATKEPEDRGFMYGRSIADPDGHLWEFFWMDPAATGETPAEA